MGAKRPKSLVSYNIAILMRPATVTIFKILIELWKKLLFVKILILILVLNTNYLNVVV